MFHPLDIFRTDPEGHVLWLGGIESFVAAKGRVEELARSSPGEYLIVDQITGHKVCVTLAGSAPASSIEDVLTAVGPVARPIRS
jgi:hypothetical protein